MAQAILMRGGGLIDLDFVTAVSTDILSPKVGADKEGEPVNGSIPTYDGSYTVVND